MQYKRYSELIFAARRCNSAILYRCREGRGGSGKLSHYYFANKGADTKLAEGASNSAAVLVAPLQPDHFQ